MTITSLNFVVFALVSVLLINAAARLPWSGARALAMLTCNLVFIASFAGRGAWSLLPMAAFVGFGLLVIHALRTAPGQRHFWPLLTLTLTGFFWLKKYGFVPEALWLGAPYVTLGLSYILFRILQIIIDTREGLLVGRLGVVDYLNYLLNFPAFISGPIQRFQDWAEQQREPLALSWEAFGEAVERIATGAFKVIVLAPVFLAWHAEARQVLAPAMPAWDTAAAGLQIVGGYAIYLFLNFSGYTDIVIGVARLFGCGLPENFNRPFAAASFLDFWARWHMSLSDWLKTYVYSPLVKNLMRRFPARRFEPYIGVVAFFVTFFLIGLWHGQTAVFALYGFLLGLGVSGNKLHQITMAKRLGRKRYAELARNAAYLALGRGLTFGWFSLSLVCFWARWDQITQLWGQLGWRGAGLTALALVLAAALVFSAADWLRNTALRPQAGGAPLLHHRYLRTVLVTALAVVTVVSVALTSGPAPDIVYKNF